MGERWVPIEYLMTRFSLTRDDAWDLLHHVHYPEDKKRYEHPRWVYHRRFAVRWARKWAPGREKPLPVGRIAHTTLTCILLVACGCLAWRPAPEPAGIVPAAYKQEAVVVRVVDVWGQPIEMASVHVHRDNRAIATTRTSALGDALLSCSTGDAWITLNARGHAVSRYRMHLEPGLRPTFTMQPEQPLSVRLLDPEHRPVVGAVIVLQGQERVGRRTLLRTCGAHKATTDADGVARFERLYAGEFEYQVFDGHRPLHVEPGASPRLPSGSAEVIDVWHVGNPLGAAQHGVDAGLHRAAAGTARGQDHESGGKEGSDHGGS